jgi:SAM-dependent methyltransferase
MNKWENFAKENAEYYILTHENVDYNTESGQKYFFESGEKEAEELLKKVAPYISGRNRCMEIGSGIGRLALANARHFTEVYAIDVAPTMLAKLNEHAQNKGIKNVKTFLPSENWDKENHFDYVYSSIVFQHIDNFDIIADYIARISRALAKDGVALLHFDTRPASLPYTLRNLAPDFMLPKSQQKGIRRIRRKSGDLKELFKMHNLQVIDELNPDSEAHHFILKRK